jgi:hypothetical protein
VVEQVHDGDLRRDPLVLEPELGDVPTHRRVQLDPSLHDQTHQRGRRIGLRDRAKDEQRVPVDGQWVVHARHAVARVDLLTVGPHPAGDAGDAELRGRRLNEVDKSVV